MAGPDRSATFALTLRLLERPFAFDFFQAVRRIESNSPGPRIGASLRAADDPVRFGQVPDLAFPASTIRAFEARRRPGENGRGQPDRLLVNFLGLFGPGGALPLHLTEHARERLRHHRDPTFTRFCDIFNHRMISLFYRAWAVNQPAVSFDRAGRDPDADRFGYYVSCLIGRGTDALRDRDALPEIAKRHFAGRLAHATRSPEGLERAIADDFGVPCEVLEFVGRWVDLPPVARLRLGESPETGTLGSTAIAGRRIWSFTHAFRLRIGPVRLAAYLRLLPAGRGFPRLVAWVRNLQGDELDWDVQLVLDRRDVPGIRLGGGPDNPPTLLGWTTWLRSNPASPTDTDRGDLLLKP